MMDIKRPARRSKVVAADSETVGGKRTMGF